MGFLNPRRSAKRPAGSERKIWVTANMATSTPAAGFPKPWLSANSGAAMRAPVIAACKQMCAAMTGTSAARSCRARREDDTLTAYCFWMPNSSTSFCMSAESRLRKSLYSSGDMIMGSEPSPRMRSFNSLLFNAK